MTIFLIGMPGCGKSTIGKLLAEHLQLPFFDTDSLIADMEAMSIPEIFEKHGETHFRKLEKELIDHWKVTNAVIATGGGLPCNNDLISKLNTKGKTLWVQVATDELVTRLSSSHDRRPMLDGLSPKEMKSMISQIFKQRKPDYQKAQIKIKGEQDIEQTVRKILRKLYT